LYVCGMFIGDGFLAKQQKVVKNKTGLSRPEYLQRCRDNKGCFTSATNIGNQTSTICHSYRIFFDVPENDNNRKKLELALTKLDIKWKAHNNKSGEHIYFASQAWCNFFEQFGKYAKNKTIPSWMFQYDYSILQELYDGLIGSDGYINPSGTGILTTVSKSLMEQSCILGTCLGYMMKVDKIPPQTSIYKNRTIRGNFDTYYIHFNQQDVTINGPNDNLTPYDDTIWCLQVEDNKNFVVERNGIFKISGNTDEVYGDITEGTHKETDLLKPSNPYSATKAAGDMLILAWARTYGVPYIIVRPTNNYGVGQYVEKLIPKACKCLFLGKKIPLHNEGKPVRNWLHAADTAQAIMRIIDFGRINQIYNIAGHFEQANIETIKQILKAMDYGDDTHHYVSQETRKGQDVRYAVDDRKLTSLGWYPSHKFEEELSEIVQYYRNKFIW